MDIEYDSPLVARTSSVKDLVRRLESQVEQPSPMRPTSPLPLTTANKISDVVSSLNNGNNENVSVFLRVRPHPTQTPSDASDAIRSKSLGTEESSVRILDNQTVQFRTIKSISEEYDKYSFTRVFSQAATQRQVFEQTTVPLVDNMFKGHDSLLFAYGVTNAGKTYTIMGKLEYNKEEEEVVKKKRQAGLALNKDKDSDGIIPRALQEIFKRIKGKEDQYGVLASYYELYNERVFDLLSTQLEHPSSESGLKEPKQRIPLKIGEEKGKVVIKDLKQTPITSHQEGKEILMNGNKCRSVGTTSLNRDSSRSHAVFTITLTKKHSNDMMIEYGKVSIVDLAGAERASRTNADGDRLKEASGINKSLLVLGRCLNCLVQKTNSKNPHLIQVPVRDSEITKIFRYELLGNAKICMIVNISPSMQDSEETANVMKYAAIAKDIKTNSRLDANRKVFLNSKLFSPPTSKTPATGSKMKKVTSQKKTFPTTSRILFQNVENDTTEEFHIDPLLIEELKKQLMENEEIVTSRIDIERAIREEIAIEMVEQMEEMERYYKTHMETEILRADEKYEKAVEGLNKTVNAYKEQLLQMEQQCVDYKKIIKNLTNESSNSILASKEEEIASLQKEMDTLKSVSYRELSEKIALQKEKLLFQNQLDEICTELEKHKKFKRENETLTEKVKELEKEVEEIKKNYSETIRLMAEEGAKKLEQLKAELNEKHQLDKEKFEKETKERFFKQFQAKTEIETENIKQELKLLKIKYESELKDKKILVDAYNKLKEQQDTNTLNNTLSPISLNTPKRAGSLVNTLKTSLRRLINTPRSSSPLKALSSPDLRKQSIGKKRKSDSTDNQESSVKNEAPKKKIKMSSRNENEAPKAVPVISKTKIQTKQKDESPKSLPQQVTSKLTKAMPLGKTRTLKLIKPGTKNLLDEDSSTTMKRAPRAVAKKVAVSKNIDKDEFSFEEESDQSSPVKNTKGPVSNLRKKTATTSNKNSIVISDEEDSSESESEEESSSEYEPTPKIKRRGRPAATKKTANTRTTRRKVK